MQGMGGAGSIRRPIHDWTGRLQENKSSKRVNLHLQVLYQSADRVDLGSDPTRGDRSRELTL